MFATVRTIKYEHLLAGISGGAISTLLLHPLDLLKIRFAGLLTQNFRDAYYAKYYGKLWWGEGEWSAGEKIKIKSYLFGL